MLDSIHLNNGTTLSGNSFNATSEGHTALIVSNSSAIVNKKLIYRIAVTFCVGLCFLDYLQEAYVKTITD
jgi:hypothetical protein